MFDRLRRHRFRTRVSLLAIAALLWSQLLLAWHADCTSGPMAAPAVAAAAQHDDCAAADEALDGIVCQSHCSQGDGSPDSPRVPLSVPLLPPDSATWTAAALLRVTACAGEAPPHPLCVSHRPTAHPAATLLI